MAKRGVRRALTAADLRAVHGAGAPTVVADIEGLDFLEGRLERHTRGVRHVQLVHDTPNDIGGFQTGPITHKGLTPFGADVVRACNRLGLLVDGAHGTADMVKQTLKVTSKPLLLSHTALEGSKAMGPTPLAGRQISRDHARAVAEAGGSIGIWHFFASLTAYVDGLREMVDVGGQAARAVQDCSTGSGGVDRRPARAPRSPESCSASGCRPGRVPLVLSGL
jgi:membrane dipeptidase